MNLIILRILGLAHIIAVNVNIASACYFAALSFCLERLFGQSCCCMCLNIRGCFLQIKNLQRNIFALIPGFPNILLGQALNVIIQSCMNHSVCCLLVLWQYSGSEWVSTFAMLQRCPIFETWSAHLLWHTQLSLLCELLKQMASAFG